jgi:hypothetical protein
MSGSRETKGLALLVGSDSGGCLTQPIGLVHNVSPCLAERTAVLAPVMSAEQQLAAAREYRADVGLGAATVAAVRGHQRLGRGKSSSHGTFLD